MTANLLPKGLHPKESPVDYFERYQNHEGPDTIWIFYRDYDLKGAGFIPPGPWSKDKKIEVQADLKHGMPPGFYLHGFDYALDINGKVCWLEYAYKGDDQMEFGVFQDASNIGLKNLGEVPEHLLLWVR